MLNQPQNALTVEQLQWIQAKMAIESRVRGGISWFYWIAGLSIVNTLLYFFGASITFVIGLGATQIVDAFAQAFAVELGSPGSTIVYIIGFIMDIVLAGIFLAAGFLGIKGHRWTVIVGMVLYALDALIFLFAQVWFGLAFHAWGLFGIWGGLQALNQFKKLPPMPGSQPQPQVIVDAPAVDVK